MTGKFESSHFDSEFFRRANVRKTIHPLFHKPVSIKAKTTTKTTNKTVMI